MNKPPQPYRLTWHCPGCNAVHQFTGTLSTVQTNATELLTVHGVVSVNISDEAACLAAELDNAEAAANWRDRITNIIGAVFPGVVIVDKPNEPGA